MCAIYKPIRFSIIIPFYNIEQYVSQCLESVVRQTYSDFEVIVVDDGSTDATGTMLDAFAQKDSRIKVLHKLNGGLTSARKAGAQVATGEYVVIVDGDDWIAENYLEKLNAIIDNNPVDIIICGYCRMLDGKAKYFSPRPIQGHFGIFGEDEICKYYLSNLFSVRQNVWAKAFRRDLYLPVQLGMEDVIRMGEDLCITYPCLVRAKQIYLLDEQLYFFRVNPVSITNSAQKYITWLECLTRMRYLAMVLPLEKYQLKKQLAGCACYSLLNVILSHFVCEDYGKTLNESQEIFSLPDVNEWISLAKKDTHFRICLIAYLLDFRMFVLLKILSMLKKTYRRFRWSVFYKL